MRYRFPEEFINRVRESNDLVEVASEYMTLTRSGDRYRGLCPFHREDTPSFFISADKQLYHCFGCGAGGNIINFVMNIENLDFIDAVKLLAERAGLPIPSEYSRNHEETRYSLIQQIYHINLTAAKFFVASLSKSKKALNYLLKRGLTAEIIKQFGLGYAPEGWDNLIKHLENKGFSKDAIAKSGLVIQRKDGGGYYDRFRDRIIFPIVNARNKVIGFGGRVLGDGVGPKYLNSPETPVFNKGSSLYGLNIAKKFVDKGEIIVVEGYMDVISLHQGGIRNTVASLGTAFTSRQADLLKRYCNNVIIAFDSDAAGRSATLKGLEILQSAGCNVKVLELPQGKDPDEFIRMSGKEEFNKLVGNALSLMDYRIKLLERRYNLQDRQQKVAFLKECTKLLTQLTSEIEISGYIKYLSQKTGIYESAIRKEIVHMKNKGLGRNRNIYGKIRHNNSAAVYTRTVKPANIEAEENLLSLMLNNSYALESISRKLTDGDFTGEFHRRLFKEILAKYRGGKVEVADLLNVFHDQEEIKKVVFLAEKQLSFDGGEEIDKFIDDCINAIFMHRERERAQLIKEQIGKLANKANRTEEEEKLYRNLCTEFVCIQRKLMGL